VVYIFDITGKPIWDKPGLIPLIVIIPVVAVGWLPLGSYGVYLNRKKNNLGTILIALSIIWIFVILIIIVSITQSLIHIMSAKLFEFFVFLCV